MNFCWNFVEICAFCIWFASGTASTRACRVDQLNIKQQRAANIFLHCLTYFDLKALRENFTFDERRPRLQEAGAVRAFGRWQVAGAAAWWQGVSVPGGMLTCSGGCFVRSARGRTREKVWGAQSAKDVQVMRSFYNKRVLTSFDVGRWNFQVVSCGQSNASVKCHVNVMCESCVNRVRLASRMTVEGQKASRESQF